MTEEFETAVGDVCAGSKAEKMCHRLHHSVVLNCETDYNYMFRASCFGLASRVLVTKAVSHRAAGRTVRVPVTWGCFRQRINVK